MTTLTPDETILGLLAIQACHGYELLETFRNPSELGNVWQLSTSQVYAVLKRLERQGWIVGQPVESPDAPTRTEYHLTPAGTQQLERWLHEPNPSASIRRVRVDFLSRLYVARQLNLPTLDIVRQQRAACAAERQRLSDALQQLPPGIGYLAQELVIAQLEAVLDWIERCELIPRDMRTECNEHCR